MSIAFNTMLLEKAALSLSAIRNKLPGTLRPNKILVTRLECLGDMVVFLPALLALKKTFPSARITLMVDRDKTGKDIVTGCPYVDRIREIVPENDPTSWGRFRFFYGVLKEYYDLVVLSTQEGNFREVLLGGSPLRLGIGGEKCSRLCNITVPLNENKSEVERNLSLVRELTTEEPPVEAEWDLGFLPHLAEFPELVELIPSLSSKKLIGVHPGAKRPSRMWMPERFSRLIDYFLLKNDTCVLITGAASEKLIISQIIDGVKSPHARERLINLCGKTTIPQMAALLRELDLFICCDTGVMQLANALETRMVVLFGPGDIVKWGPTRNRDGTAVVHHQVDCSPCYRFECRDHKCMKNIKVEEVIRAAEKLLA